MIAQTSGDAWTIRFIEFVGLPGSGKSTVAVHLGADLMRYGIKTISRATVLADNSPFVWRQCRRLLLVSRHAGECWRLYQAALKLILASGQRSFRDAAKVTWNFWSIIALMADSRKNVGSLIVVDQGLLQAIWSVQLSASRTLATDLWKDLLLAAGIKDVLIVNIRSEIEIARHRVLKRTSSETRLGRSSGRSSDSEWTAASAGMSCLLQLAEEVFPSDGSGDRIITIENSAAPPEIAAMKIASAFLARRALSDASH